MSNTATRPDFHIITTTEELHSLHWPMGTVIQEIHDGQGREWTLFYEDGELSTAGHVDVAGWTDLIPA